MPLEVEQIGPCTLYRGDCRDILPTLPPVDAVLTDIPYGVGMLAFDDNLHVGIEGLNLALCSRAITWLSPGKIAPFMKAASWNLLRVLWMEKTADIAFPWHGWLMNGEAILVLGRPGGRWPRPETLHRDCYSVGPWERTGHPTGKPLSVTKDLLQKVSTRGETVMDMFAGSCTTGLACVELGRSFIGIEQERQWFDLGCSRLEEALRQPDFFLLPPRAATQLRLFA